MSWSDGEEEQTIASTPYRPFTTPVVSRLVVDWHTGWPAPGLTGQSLTS